MKITTNKIIIGIFTVIVIWALSGYLISLIDPINRGSFGDMFGAVNALFSGLALFGIVLSILIQQKELNSQREELQETRKEFKTNRITSILFKQVEFLNSSIDKLKFYQSGQYQFDGVKSLDDFTYILNELEITQQPKGIKVLIEANSNNISIIITRVHSALKNFEGVLSSSGLEANEELQIKKLFKSNISPSLSMLFHYHIRHLKFLIEQLDKNKNLVGIDKDFIQVEKSLYKLDLERISEILKFGND